MENDERESDNEFSEFINYDNDVMEIDNPVDQEPQEHLTEPYDYDAAVKVLGYDPIKEFPDVFPTTKPTELPPLRDINHKIDIIDDEAYRSIRSRRIKPTEAFLP